MLYVVLDKKWNQVHLVLQRFIQNIQGEQLN